VNREHRRERRPALAAPLRPDQQDIRPLGGYFASSAAISGAGFFGLGFTENVTSGEGELLAVKTRCRRRRRLILRRRAPGHGPERH
jgi:hypothetical protein